MTLHRGAVLFVRFAIAFALTVPVPSQDEQEPYFALTSSQSFAPGSKPFIQVSSYGVNALRIRVYRIHDPVQFMRQLGDPHQFGGAYAVPRGKLTLLERLHQWKSELRRNIRQNLRDQFTDPPSRHFSFITPSTARTKPAYFAEAPVLNPSQLVLSFLQPMTPTQNRWDSQQIDIPVQGKGVFLVEAVHGSLRAYTILGISDLVLLAKTGLSHVLYYVADRKTGEPVPNATVTTLERDEAGTDLKTGRDGTAEFEVNNAPASDLRVIAVSGKDVAFSDLESWSFNARTNNLTGLVYTDRPIYRPGDAVQLRGILRNLQTTGYSVPASQLFNVQISDRDGKPVYQKDLAANGFGIIHDELTLAKEAPLGSYTIQVQSAGSSVAGNFDVQEYKKPEYEVHVTPESRRVLQGQSTKITIDSRYYFGEPVAGAKVKYSIYKSRYWFPLWYDPDDDDSSAGQSEPDDYGANEQESELTGQLDADGKLVITLDSDVSEHKADTLYRIEAGVTDQVGREISGTGWVIATYGTFVIDVQPQKWFYQPSETATFKLETRDYGNHPVSSPVHIELWRRGRRGKSDGELLAQADAKTNVDGAGSVQLKLPQSGGDYRVVATAPNSGRFVQSQTAVWVSGENAFWDEGQSVGSVPIVPDKKTYHAGEMAHIMIAAGLDNAPVLVTVEGRDVQSHVVLQAKGGSAMFSYPITAANEPALWVSAEFFRDGKLHQGVKRIKIPPEDHKLNIKLSTDKPQYQPGQPATYQVDVTTPEGKPASQTDLSLGVVDEAIYGIEKDTTPDPLDAFYGRDYNSVQSQDSLTYYFSGEAGTRRMRLALLRPSTRLAQLKPEQLVKPKVRKYFPDTTFWAADLTTDARGHAQAQFAFPDSLTTWRATARGVSRDDRYGAAVLKTIVRKNLMVRLAVPRSFVQGDEVVISAIVHNYLQFGKQARVELKLNGLTLLTGEAQQDISVSQRAEVKVDWRVKASQALSATIDGEALTNEESDAVQVQLPIHPPGVPVRDPHSGSILGSGSISMPLAFPNTAVSGSRSINIHMTPSVAGSLFSALQYLTSYPYGCVEQTMSSFLPDIVVTQTMRDLNLKQPIDQNQLDQQIQAGLDRLRSFRHEDGGWGWWTTDDSDPFMTAYVVAGLSQARAAGISIDNDEIEGGVKWTGNYLKAHKNVAPDLQAYMQYAAAVASHANGQALDALYARRSELSSYGLALLGLAFDTVQDKRAGDIAQELVAAAQQDGSEAYWPAFRDEMLDFAADVTPETTAYVTKLLSKRRPNSPLLAKAALWLVNHRNEGYWWDSTKETAMVIYGLVDYVKASHELNPDLHATVLVNGQVVGSATFQKENIADVSSITVDESKLQAVDNNIQIQTKGSGRMYYSVSADHYTLEPKAQERGSISLNLLRDYYRLVPSLGAPIVYDIQPLSGAVAQGDVLAVRLTVTGSNWRYLLVEDPIPAGTEFIKEDNLYHLRVAPAWWTYWFTERENHDDRIALFHEYFGRGQMEYFYLLKVVNPGLFHINPARVQPMYQPEYQATTSAATLEVK